LAAACWARASGQPGSAADLMNFRLGDGSWQIAEHIMATATGGDPAAALREFTSFSESRGLGMHLGAEKTSLLESAVRQGLPPTGPAIVLEVGCHAGDGTLGALAALHGRAGSTIVSTEANPEWLKSAKAIVDHAAKGTSVRFLPLELGEEGDLDMFLDDLKEKHSISAFDTVIFDHSERMFLTHLRVLLRKGYLRAGSTVYVDNVKRKAQKLRKYLEFVNTKAKKGFQTVITHVKKPYPDAVAVSVYVGSTEL